MNSVRFFFENLNFTEGLIFNGLSQGKSPSELIGLPLSLYNSMCKASFDMIGKEKIEAAADSFLFLTTLDPWHQLAWLGLGISYQLLGNYQSAMEAYQISAACDPLNPFPYYYFAKCLALLNDKENAREFGSLAADLAADHDEYLELLAEIKQLLLSLD